MGKRNLRFGIFLAVVLILSLVSGTSSHGTRTRPSNVWLEEAGNLKHPSASQPITADAGRLDCASLAGIQIDRSRRCEGSTSLNAQQQDSTALYPQQTGFPIQTYGWNRRSSPIVADLDNDGDNEILVTNYGGWIYAWDSAGTSMPGYPLLFDGIIEAHLALGDLDSDGNLEIAVPVGSTVPGVEGQVYILEPDGTALPGWPRSMARHGSARPLGVSTVALADVDSDGDLEVIAASDNNELGCTGQSVYAPDLYLWHHNGEIVSGNWPVEDECDVPIGGAVAVGDLNSNGRVDIVVGRDYNRLFAYDDLGADLPAWPVHTFLFEEVNWLDPQIEFTVSTPTLADLDRDGIVEYIIAGLRRPPDSGNYYNSDLLVLEPDGKRRLGWELPYGGTGLLAFPPYMQQSPTVADLNGDGQLEIIVPTQDGWIRAYEADKSVLWQFNYAQGSVVFGSEAVIGDIDDDSLFEIIFGTHDPLHGSSEYIGVWILEHDGTVKTGTPLSVEKPGVMSAPSLADLDRDGDLEIAAVTSQGLVYVWDTPGNYDVGRLPWPMARGNVQRTAFFEDPRPDLTFSRKTASAHVPSQGDLITYTISLNRDGSPLTNIVRITDSVPNGLEYIPDSLTSSHGTPDASSAPVLHWAGLLSDTDWAEITYAVKVTTSSPTALINNAIIDAGDTGRITRSALVIANGKRSYLPVTFKD